MDLRHRVLIPRYPSVPGTPATVHAAFLAVPWNGMFSVWRMNEFIPGELQLTIAANSLHHGLVGAVANFVYGALEPAYSVILVLGLAALLAWRRRDYRAGLIFGGAIATAWLPVVFIKMLVARPRPDAALLPYPTAVTPGDWSFPSGHSAFVTALAVVTIIVMRHRWARAAAVLLALTTYVSVLVCGVHYPTDVVASIVWGLAVTPLTFKLAFRVGSRLPVLSQSGLFPSSFARSGRTYPRRTPSHRAQTPRRVTARG